MDDVNGMVVRRRHILFAPAADAAAATAAAATAVEMKLGDGGFVLPGRKFFRLFALGLLAGFGTPLIFVALGLLRSKNLIRVFFVNQVYTEDDSLEKQE